MARRHRVRRRVRERGRRRRSTRGAPRSGSRSPNSTGTSRPRRSRPSRCPTIKSFRVAARRVERAAPRADAAVPRASPTISCSTRTRRACGAGPARASTGGSRATSPASSPSSSPAASTPRTSQEAIDTMRPFAVDLSSSVEAAPGVKDFDKLYDFFDAYRAAVRGRVIHGTTVYGTMHRAPTSDPMPAIASGYPPDERGRFGAYGGAFVPEILIPVLAELKAAYAEAKGDPDFQRERRRPAARLRRPADAADVCGPADGAARRAEDLPQARGPLPHGRAQDQQHDRAGAARAADGQAAHHRRDRRGPARRRHGHRLRASSGSSASSTWARRTSSGRTSTSSGCGCSAPRSAPPRAGAGRSRTPRTRPSATGSRTRDDTFYIIGSVVGPHPYPMMVRDFHRVIGEETRRQLLARRGPRDARRRRGVRRRRLERHRHLLPVPRRRRRAARRRRGRGRGARRTARRDAHARAAAACCHGAMSYLLQDAAGQVEIAHSISAGLDYPGVGPEHSYLKDTGRVDYRAVTDAEALDGVKLLSRDRGHHPRARNGPRRRRAARALRRDGTRTTSSSSTSPAAATRTWRRSPRTCDGRVHPHPRRLHRLRRSSPARPRRRARLPHAVVLGEGGSPRHRRARGGRVAVLRALRRRAERRSASPASSRIGRRSRTSATCTCSKPIAARASACG